MAINAAFLRPTSVTRMKFHCHKVFPVEVKNVFRAKVMITMARIGFTPRTKKRMPMPVMLAASTIYASTTRFRSVSSTKFR